MKAASKFLWVLACMCISIGLISCSDSDNDTQDDELSYCSVFMSDKNGNDLFDNLDIYEISVTSNDALLEWKVRSGQSLTRKCVIVKYLLKIGEEFEFTIDWGNGWKDTILIVRDATKKELYVNGVKSDFCDPGIYNLVALIRE